MPFIFHQHHLDLLELHAGQLNAENCRIHYRKCLLKWSDKGGSADIFQRGHAAYHALLDGLRSFAVWHSVHPETSVADTIYPTPGRSTGSSSAAQPVPRAPDLAPAPDLATTFHAEGHCKLYPSLEEALQQIRFSFTCSWTDMANVLKLTAVGETVTFDRIDRAQIYQRGAAQPAAIRYHGAYFQALIAISKDGFRPVWGAGRGQALERFGDDKPVVYTSSDQDQASWYPQAMVDGKGNRVGELLCLGCPPMRVVLICSAPIEKRRIKIRRGKNKQDAWLPEDLEVEAVMFVMMKDAINEPKPMPKPAANGAGWGQYNVDLESSDDEPEQESETIASHPEQQCDSSSDESVKASSDESDGSQPSSDESLSKRPRLGSAPAGSVPSTTPPPTTAAQRGPQPAAASGRLMIRSLVARQCMLLRIHKDDLRSTSDIAYDYAQLVLLRHKYVLRNRLDWDEPLSKQDQIKIWDEELHWLFLDERPTSWSRRTTRKLRSIKRVWIRECFGNVRALRAILKNSCSWATWHEIEFRQNVMTAVCYKRKRYAVLPKR